MLINLEFINYSPTEVCYQYIYCSRNPRSMPFVHIDVVKLKLQQNDLRFIDLTQLGGPQTQSFSFPHVLAMLLALVALGSTYNTFKWIRYNRYQEVTKSHRITGFYNSEFHSYKDRGPPGTFHILIGKFSYFIIRFHYMQSYEVNT